MNIKETGIFFFFIPTWDEVLAGMKLADIPNDVTLRDLLYRKMKNFNVISYDLQLYNNLNEGDPKKSY